MDKIYKVDREILFYAFRYSLGRMTFAPNIVMDNIKANIKDISDGDLKAYIREIMEQEHIGYGMEMDKKSWLNFKEYLENELLLR